MDKNEIRDKFLKNKKLYILVVIATIILFLSFYSKYENGDTGTWGVNRSLTSGWNFCF